MGGGAGLERLRRLGVLATVVTLAVVVLGLPFGANASGTWTLQTSGTTNNLIGGACSNLSTCIAVGASGTVLATTDGGTTWTAQTSPTTANLDNASCPSTSYCIAVGDAGAAIVTTNGGATWTDVTAATGTTKNLEAIRCVSTTTCFAAGQGGTVLTTSNFGASWTAMTGAFTNNLWNIDCTDASDCWAVGGAGKIEYWNGTTWAAQTSNTANTLQGLSCTSTTSCWAVGASGTIDYWNGTVWATQTSGVAVTLYSISCPKTTYCWTVGGSGTILETSDGSTWTVDTSNTGKALNKVAFADFRYGFAFGNTGVVDAYANPDTTPPNPFSLTAPSATADVSNGVTLSSSPTDDSSVASVAYGYCPGTTCTWATSTLIGTTTSGPPFTVTWSGQPANGTYSLIARATDPYGNHTDSSTTTVYVNNPTSSAGAGVSSLSWSHTVVAGSNSVLVVGVTAEHTTNACQAASVTYGGTPLTQISTALSSSASFECASLWYMLAPPVGTATVSVSFGSALNGASAGATTLFGIKQAAPDAFSTGSSTTGAATTNLTTLAASSTVVDVFASGVALGNLAPAAGQTALWTQNDASTGQASGGSSSKTVASAGATSVTWTQTGINQSAQVAAAFAPPDTTPPNAFSITSPTAGASVANGQTISSSPTDPNSAVASVAYGYCPGSSCTFATSTAIGTATSGPPFSVTWTSQPANGTYTLIARATDPSGNYTDSSTTTVTVANGSSQSWYSSSWQYRKAITIDHTKVAGNLTNFPVLINLPTDSDLAANAQASGNDILFTASDGVTKLNDQIESYTSATGALVAWVQVPSLSSTADTTIYMYYGNPSAASQQNAAGVWDTNYKGVYHLPNGTTLSLADSTSNANNGTNAGATAGSGQIYGGAAFNGTNQDFTTTATGFPAINGSMTISGWFYVPSSAGFATRDIATLYSSGSTTADQFRITASGTLQVSEWGGTIAITGTKTITTNAWHYGVFTYSGTTASLYLDGQLDTSATVSVQAGTASSLLVGTYGSGEYWNGSIDEVRVSNTARSAQWIQTEYNNQASASTFYSLGTPQQQSWYSPSWTYRKAITINHTQVYGNFTNFPVLINLASDANLAAHAQASGNDILFTSSDGVTKLNDEIESYNSSTGALVAWVQVPTLSSTADTTIYMYFGNASASNQSNPTGTWDSNYAGVYHLTNGTTLSLADSTANARTGTNHGATATTGDFDGGAGLASASSQYASLPSAVLPASDNFTVSAWFKTTSSGVIVSEQNQPIGSTPTTWDPLLYVDSTGKLRGGVYAGGQPTFVSSTTVNNGAWHYAVLVVNASGTTQSLYLDGALVGSFSGTPEAISTNVSVGAGWTASWTNGNNGTYYFNGTIDEVRFSSSATARSATWIQTEWGNGSSPGTFYTVGGLQSYLAPCSGGALTLAVPSLVTFPSVTLNGSDQAPTTTVTLTPDDETASGAGWNITGTSTTLKTSSGATLPTSATTITAATATANTQSCTLPTNQIGYPVTLPAGSSPPTAVKLFDAKAGTGKGASSVALTVKASVPANAYNGTYTSTWTIATVSGP